MARTTESTSFTKDVQGRYLCNDINEVNAWKTTPGGRPFDFIIVGGGTFGAAIAEHLWFRQKERGGGLRVLVLEGGPFTVPEHVQNSGIQGFFDPGTPFFLNESAPQPEPPKNEVWGVPWKSDIAFKGLAYAIGGRSVYWGGWSPRLLDQEVVTWPPSTVGDLKNRYFDEAAAQIGTDATNDFIFGPLHTALRRQLFDRMSAIGSAIPLADLPPSPLLKAGGDPLPLLGLSDPGGLQPDDLRNLLKLEAPLAVQAHPPHAGFFPLNKFSTVPLLMKASRTAYADNSDDARKEFMILPFAHAVGLQKIRSAAGTWRITGVDTSQGFVELAPGGAVVIALGTIESARLALLAFDGSGIPTFPRMGKNLMAHLRSNMIIRVPRTAVAGIDAAVNELQTSALFLKGQFKKNGQVRGTFHVQISACGGANSAGADAELFQKIPDVDFYEALGSASDTHVVIAMRAIGEIAAADFNNVDAHQSRVELYGGADEYGARRARVTLVATQAENDLWAAMDEALVQLANVFANGGPKEILQNNHDGLGTTHHEAGTLWMGDDAARSVTDAEGRFHFTDNLYAAGPALFPSIGSPNPMLTGIALARRTGDRILEPRPFVADAGFESLFDGIHRGDWRMSTIRNQPGRDDPGRFLIRRGAFEARPGTDLGLLWLNRPTPPRYALRLQWMTTAPDDNSGVFVAFPNPEGEGYDNAAWVGVNLGFEVQIDELARPDNAPIHRTAAIYSFKGATDGALVVHPPGEWNQYEIIVDGANLTVSLNGAVVNVFHFNGDPQSPRRGQASTAQEPRFIGLQTHTGRVLFRNIQWKAL